MGRKRNRPKHEGTVLRDHKKIGSTFVPPLLAQVNLNELSYVRDLLPEITWLGLAHQQLGHRDAAALCTETAKLGRKCFNQEQVVNFGLLRSYRRLSPTQVGELVTELQRADLITPLRTVLEPLVALIPACPLAIVGLPPVARRRPALVEDLRRCVRELIDKWGTPASVAQATLVYIKTATGGLFWTGDAHPPDLEAIITAPESDAGRHAAAVVRAIVLSETPTPDEATLHGCWAREFWNAALHLDECTFEEPQHGD